MKIGIRAFVYDDVDMQLMVSSLMEEGSLPSAFPIPEVTAMS
ncbi:MAG: hypothetical protein ACLRMZ_16260 [Blautia marasmi]